VFEMLVASIGKTIHFGFIPKFIKLIPKLWIENTSQH